MTGTTEAFHQLGNVNITFAENIKSIGKEAFKGTNLKSVEFENDEMYINPEAFCDCAKLTKVSFDKIVAVGDMAFQNCERLTAVNLTNKKLRVIGDGVFAGCDAIEDVVFGVNDYKLACWNDSKCSELYNHRYGQVNGGRSHAFQGCVCSQGHGHEHCPAVHGI